MKDMAAASLIAALLCAMPGAAQSKQSAHRKGPHHLEGWTILTPMSDAAIQDAYPVTLVIARHGQIIRRISGQPFVWSWTFWKNGTQIAYQVGPLHFAMQCVLADVATGRELATIDCFSNPPGTLPAWADALERQP